MAVSTGVTYVDPSFTRIVKYTSWAYVARFYTLRGTESKYRMLMVVL